MGRFTPVRRAQNVSIRPVAEFARLSQFGGQLCLTKSGFLLTCRWADETQGLF
jgi:hypothetical protein